MGFYVIALGDCVFAVPPCVVGVEVRSYVCVRARFEEWMLLAIWAERLWSRL